MKRTFTTLAVLASLTAGGASAFGVNANNAELNSIEGTPAVADLSVGVKAVILSWMGFCSEEGRLYLDANTQLVTEPNEYGYYYEITRQPDGEFAMSYGPNGKGTKILPGRLQSSCESYITLYGETAFLPVASINGFTDLRSFWIDLVNKGYKRYER
jgi:hypothetical protein